MIAYHPSTKRVRPWFSVTRVSYAVGLCAIISAMIAYLEKREHIFLQNGRWYVKGAFGSEGGLGRFASRWS